MPWPLLGLAVVVLLLAGLAATGRLGGMPEPPVEDEWIRVPDEASAGQPGGQPDDPPARGLADAG